VPVTRTVADLRARLRDAPRPVGLVPTMGALHDGHLALVRAARAECATVVVSVFVNPAQFDEAADLAAYPRDEARDAELATAAGADLVFAPGAAEVYPPGFATTVSVSGVSERYEGAVRGRAHFDGVATVVLKLLNMAGPDRAYFGQKDAQQVAVLRRLVRDLDVPVELRVLPTVREPDGLALSSRNARLSPEERSRALALSRALRVARERGLEAARAELDDVDVDYLDAVDPDTFTPVATGAPALVVVAARVGDTRLIDNTDLNGAPST
jgi:pantoate--beta-alanine ligase